MSGNLWMFSDKLDDEDIEMLKHEFITYYQGADYYGLGLKMFTRMAHEAGAVYKIGKKVLIRRTIFDEYLRKQYRITQETESRESFGREANMQQIKRQTTWLHGTAVRSFQRDRPRLPRSNRNSALHFLPL